MLSYMSHNSWLHITTAVTPVRTDPVITSNALIIINTSVFACSPLTCSVTIIIFSLFFFFLLLIYLQSWRKCGDSIILRLVSLVFLFICRLVPFSYKKMLHELQIRLQQEGDTETPQMQMIICKRVLDLKKRQDGLLTGPIVIGLTQ